MTTAAIELSGSLQALVDSRLDTIDRMLMGRVPRQDRLAIVREVEAQVFELLQERGAEELTREDVLAVLARLDPPEAYLPEEKGIEPMSAANGRPGSYAVQPVRRAESQGREDQRHLGTGGPWLSSCSVPFWATRSPSQFGSIAVYCAVWRDRIEPGLHVGYHGDRPGDLFADGKCLGRRGDSDELRVMALRADSASTRVLRGWSNVLQMDLAVSTECVRCPWKRSAR